MKLIYPLQNATITQHFGDNANGSYASDGLKGHTAIDLVSVYNSPILAAVTGEVYSLMNKDNPDPMKYRAVFQIYDDIDYSYEVSYGHCNFIYAEEGKVYEQGQPLSGLASEGNTGTCYVGNHLISREEKLGGSTAGFHTHFQTRKCIRVTKRDPKKHYLENSEGRLKRNDFYYEIVDYDNGYNGCVDPAPFLKDRPSHIFLKNLKYKDTDLEVMNLQACLQDYGTFIYPELTTYYGEETRKAVLAFQVKEKVAPWYTVLLPNQGKYVYEATRKRLNELYGSLEVNNR